MKRRRQYTGAVELGAPRTVAGLVFAEDLSQLVKNGLRRLTPARTSSTSPAPRILH
jgi:hypothetical protein